MIDVLVTGAGGFVGRTLIRRLELEGRFRVLRLDRSSGDICDAKTWSQVPPAAAVFHLAARTFVPDSWQDSAAFMQTNIIGTEQALAYCRQHGAKLILPSTYVYGAPPYLPIDEAAPARPSNPYALSKWMAEELCAFAQRIHGVSSVILRLFNVFGPGEPPEFLIPTIIRQVREGREIRLQSLTPRRDYVFADDVVDALILALNAPVGCHRVNIASGQSYSVQEVVDLVQAIAGTQLPVLSAAIERPHEILDTKADISLAKQLLNWQPRVSFSDGLRNAYEGKSL